CVIVIFFFFSSRRRHTRSDRDWSSDVCSSDLLQHLVFATKEDFSSELPGSGSPRLGRLTQELLFQPGNILVKESARLCNRTAARSEERRVGKECSCGWWP